MTPKKRLAKALRVNQPDLDAAVEAGHLTVDDLIPESAARIKAERPRWLVEARAAKQSAAARERTRSARPKNEWSTQTEMGVVLGLSPIQVGRALVAAGLRVDGEPTPEAMASGLTMRCSLDSGKIYYRWHRSRTLTLLRKAGFAEGSAADRARAAQNAAQAKRKREAANTARLAFEQITWSQDPMADKMARLILDSADDPDLAWAAYDRLVESGGV